MKDIYSRTTNVSKALARTPTAGCDTRVVIHES